MKGLFIPEITAEMFRNGCLESIEALMAEGKIYDIEYSKWIPVSERLPKKRGEYLVTQKAVFSDYVYRSIASYSLNLYDVDEYNFLDKKRPGWYDCDSEGSYYELDDVIAWMPLPEPYKAEREE